MNTKNILTILLLSLISGIQCFAVKPTIDIPFKNISSKINYHYHKTFEQAQSHSKVIDLEKFEKDQAEKARTNKTRPRQRYYYDTEPIKDSNSKDEVCGVEIQLVVKDPKTGTDIFLTKRNFDKLQGDMPLSRYFQEHFMIQGKSARIHYTVDIEYISVGEKQIVESIDLNVLSASINGIDWPKNTSDKKLSGLLLTTIL